MNTDITQYSETKKIRCPYIAYFLGFLCGDGYLFHHTQWNSRGVGCEQNELDLKHVKRIFNKIARDWRFLNRKVKGRYYGRIYRTDWKMHDFLKNLGYENKSRSHSRVLSIIDKNVKNCFILGLFDADGNIYTKKDGKKAVACLCGPINQNWRALTHLLNENNIENIIKKRIDKNKHKYSYLFIKNIFSLMNFYLWLYKDCPKNLFFRRKKKSFDIFYNYFLNGLPRRYGSMKYAKLKRYDYSSFAFKNFEVIKPIDTSSKDWKWECIFPDGEKRILKGSYLRVKKNEELNKFKKEIEAL